MICMVVWFFSVPPYCWMHKELLTASHLPHYKLAFEFYESTSFTLQTVHMGAINFPTADSNLDLLF